MTNKLFHDQTLPITKEQLSNLNELIKDFSHNQIAWISGYFWGLLHNKSVIYNEKNIIKNFSVTIISASQTGNARTIAKNLQQDLTLNKIENKLINASDYNFKKISKEKYLIIITSTQGEGEPPEEAFSLYEFIMSKKAPKMSNTNFSVFGLGDSSYAHFSKAGKDFNNRLLELGGIKILDCVNADIDYEEKEKKWRKSILEIFCNKKLILEEKNSIVVHKKTEKKIYNKENPLLATLINKQKITGRFSEKDIKHIEIDINNSGLTYTPGDSLGIWYENDEKIIEEILYLCKLNKNLQILLKNKKITLFDALKKNFELTVNTPNIVKYFANLSRNKFLLRISESVEKLKKYSDSYPIIEMLKSYPFSFKVDQLINMLRPLKPRFYSISSSQLENENEVHITVSTLRYNVNYNNYTGGASGYLSDRIKEDDKIKIFVEKNNNFRLPIDHNLPIIMIGPGTGIAPFRAFIQHRINEKAKGKNWLFFGNPKFTEDFLYQTEWQYYTKLGFINKIDLAWSRDQKEKIYVQNKIQEKSKKIWKWIQKGAHIYICGNAEKMAKDVEKVLLEDVISKNGNMNIEFSKKFLNKMRISRRYQRDIY